MIAASLEAARKGGARLVPLVGDLPYYGPLGFQQVEKKRVVLPGPVDPARVLVAELEPGAFEGVSGVVKPNWEAVR
jgi:predicted N-acetyltransferase YhbS